ncbi:right-handed parallel beta-helix repeat-containing protein [Methanohalophilus levihalophilus]|uniref:right-handed parallel beta-helix repeat-containing protein n=1 Tax=Methanohalophilus levihalophilus TaxID=1431282 RepID=UPI001AE94F44
MGSKARGVICVLVLFFILLATTSTVFASTLKVAESGDKIYSTIQEAVINASKGDTLLVYPGTYVENIYIDKELTIIANSDYPSDVIIQAARMDEHILHIKADGVTISGFIIKDSKGPEKTGIYLDSVENCNISHNVLSDNQNGVGLLSSSGNILIDNSINSSHWVGIYLERSHDNLLANNSIVLNGRDGVDFEASNNNLLKNNTINLNKQNGISLISSNGNTISNNKINSNNQFGLLLEESSNNTLSDNSVLDNIKGINIEGYAGNHIYGNNIVDKETQGMPFINPKSTLLILGIVFVFLRVRRKI